MIKYKRRIRGVIFLLWTLLFVGGTLTIYFFFMGLTLAAGVTLLILILFHFYEVRGLTLMEGQIHIDRYSIYGFKHQRTLLDNQSGIKAELFVNGDIDQVLDSDSALGLAVLLIPFLYKKYALWLKDSNGRTIFILKLTKKEFSIFNDALQFDKALPLT